MMTRSCVDVAFAFDHDYLVLTVAAAASLVRTLDHQCSVVFNFLVDETVTRDDRARVDRALEKHGGRCVVRWITLAEDRVKHLTGNGKWPRSAFYRLLLPEFLPRSVDTVLYLDGDLVVCNDVSGLFCQAADHVDADAWAVVDTIWPSIAHRRSGFAACGRSAGPWEAIGETCPYHNSGVLLMNLMKWRENRLADHVFAAMKAQQPFCQTVDQDAMHLAGITFGELHPRWNIQLGAAGYFSWHEPDASYESRIGHSLESLLEYPGIVHFAGDRPWNGMVPGRAYRQGTAEWFYWHNLCSSGLFSLPELVGLRLNLARKGCARFVKEAVHRYRHRSQLSARRAVPVSNNSCRAQADE